MPSSRTPTSGKERCSCKGARSCSRRPMAWPAEQSGGEAPLRNLQKAVEDQAFNQLERDRQVRRHLPARAAGHEAGGLGAAVVAYVLHHALDRTGDCIGAPAGERIAGVRRKLADITGRYV